MKKLSHFCVGGALSLSVVLAARPADAAPAFFSPSFSIGFKPPTPGVQFWTGNLNRMRTPGPATPRVTVHDLTTSEVAVSGNPAAALVQTFNSFKAGQRYQVSFSASGAGVASVALRPRPTGFTPVFIPFGTHFAGHTKVFTVTKTGSYQLGALVQLPSGATPSSNVEHLTNFRIALLPSGVPEASAESGAAAVALALGGLAMMLDRRRKVSRDNGSLDNQA